MKIHLDSGEGRNSIHRYAVGEIVVNERAYAGSVIVTPRDILEDWPPLDVASLTAEHFEPIYHFKPELVLIGTGARLTFPESSLLAGLMSRGIGHEIMDTGAACRTFNILTGEGRFVVAALMAIRSPAPGRI